MSEDIFWEVIKEVGWPTLSSVEFRDENLAKGVKKGQLIVKFGKQICEDTHLFVREKARALREILKDHRDKNQITISYSGDDGVWDLCCHIVGLGKIDFEDHLRNADKIYMRWQRGRYEENFLYWIPLSDDPNVIIPNTIKYINDGDFP